MQIETSYLREKAHYCVVLARGCPDLTTSRALEALGVELMEKAADLDRGRSLTPQAEDGRKRPKRA